MATRSQQLRVVISGDASALRRAFASAEMQGSKFEQKMGGVTSRVGSAIRHLSVGAFAGAGFGLMALVKAGVDYEKEMARVKAVTGATGAQFKGLGDLAKQLGKDTKFSAGEAAQAMYELGSAGFKAGEMSKVLPGVLSLASASSMSLADAAEISANALRGFGLDSSKMGHVADVMAKSVATSSLELTDLQLSMKYISGVAVDTGQSFESMTAALSLMAAAGIKGEQGGTSLRGGLLRLVKPTKMVEAGLGMLNLKVKDLHGPNGLKPLAELVRLLTKHSEGLDKATRNTAITQIFGTEAFSGMSKVLNAGAPALEKLTQSYIHSDGASKKMADTMNHTVAGAFENLKGTVETVGITIFEKFQEPLRKGLLGASKLINDFPSMVKSKFDANKLLPAPHDSNTNIIARMIGDGIAGVDWKGLGGKIAKGIGKGVKLSGDFADAVATGISQALSHVDGGKLLGGLVKVVGQAINAVFSPKWWKDHFKDVFATVEIAIPLGKILHIPGAKALFDHITKPINEALKKVGKWLFEKFKGIASDGVTGFLSGLANFAPKTADILLNVVTGTGKWLSGLPGKFKSAGSRAVNAIIGAISGAVGKISEAVGNLIGAGLKKLGSLVPDFVKAGAKFAHELISGLVRGLTSLPKKLGGAVKKAIGAIGGAIGIGEGIGRTMQPPGGGKGSAALMGAQSALGPYAAIGARFGLHVSSGRRPGAITSSGNRSYHDTGEAIDEAGSSSGMMRFFKYMRDRFGSRLAELIYTPGGAGIKDGHSYTYTGQVAADHFDHVHVALDTGKPGVGDGLGKFVATSYGPPWGGIQGTGVTASGVNLKNNPHIYGIAADPSVLKMGSRVKVNPNPFGYGGAFKVFDTGGAIKGRRIDFYDWRGRSKQNAWGSRAVTISTADGSSGNATSRDALDARLQKNLDQLDTLRNSLANVPADRHHVKQRKVIQAQIRSLVSANRALRGDIRTAPTATDIKTQQEKIGSRIVNAVAGPIMRGKGGINALKGSISGSTLALDTMGTEYGQAERRFGQSDEDLGTKVGRDKRISELKELAKLKQAQLGRQKQELAAVVSAIKKYDTLIRQLKGKLKKTKGVTAARIRKRLKDYDDARLELVAQGRSLGAAIEDTKLDIGDLFKEGADVAATENTPVEPGPTVTDRTSDLTSIIDLKERAGLIDAGTANQQRIDVITAAIQGKFGATTEREQLQLMGDLRDAQQASAQAVTDNTQALKDLQKSIDDNTAFAKSVMATENASLTRSIADLISGQIAGVGIAGRGLMPGTAGVRARY